jgi:hypothetical protein
MTRLANIGHSKLYDAVIHPDTKFTAAFTFSLFVYTTTSNYTTRDLVQTVECKNIRLGNGTIGNFHYHIEIADEDGIPGYEQSSEARSVETNTSLVTMVLFHFF